MLSSLLTFSSAISRLNLWPKPSLHYALSSFKSLKPHNQQITINWSPLSASLYSLFSRFSTSTRSSSPKSRMEMMNLKDDLVILGIETSCDDAATVVVTGNGKILSQVVSSQAKLLALYGAIAPKMAEEAHSHAIDQVVQNALDQANLTAIDLSAVAVTMVPV